MSKSQNKSQVMNMSNSQATILPDDGGMGQQKIATDRAIPTLNYTPFFTTCWNCNYAGMTVCEQKYTWQHYSLGI